MPVPFGFGVIDIIVVGSVVRNVYATYAGAPKQFRNLSQEILSLHVVVGKIEDQLGIWGSGGAAGLAGCGGLSSLSTKTGNDLKILYDDLRTLRGNWMIS